MRKEWPLWERFYTEVKQIVLNSWYVKTMGVHRRETGIFPSQLEIGTKNQNFQKTWRQQLNSDWLIYLLQWQFISRYETHTALEPGSSGVMQWWACSSLISTALPAGCSAEAGCQTCDRIVLLLVFVV